MDLSLGMAAMGPNSSFSSSHLLPSSYFFLSSLLSLLSSFSYYCRCTMVSCFPSERALSLPSSSSFFFSPPLSSFFSFLSSLLLLLLSSLSTSLFCFSFLCFLAQMLGHWSFESYWRSEILERARSERA